MALGLLNSIKVEGKFERKHNNVVSFRANSQNTPGLPKILHPTPKELEPVKLPGVPKELASKIIEAANDTGSSVADYLGVYLRHLMAKATGVIPEPSVTANVGKTKVTTLIDGKQIFDRVCEDIKSAEKSIQIEMFEMQNLKVDGDIWPSAGAETLPGWSKQQQILDMLVKKKQANPNMKIQVILDVHKWYQDGFGNRKRHYSNMKMISYLKEHGIDVVPYPRPQQGGTVLQHVKMLAVDGKKVVLGGMNWGNHSSANHDACIAIETLPNQKNSEVDNIINDIFNKDWKFAWQRLGKTKFVPGPTTPEEQKDYKGKGKQIKEEAVEYMKLVGNIFNKPEYLTRFDKGNLDLVEVKPIATPAIKVLVNNPREYALVGENGEESIGKYIKERIDNCTSLKAELFVLSHKEIVNKIIQRFNEAKNGGRPFDVQLIISPGILDDFPYCRQAFSSLEEAGVPIRVYNVNKEITQRLHTKWAVFDNQDLLIGSANWSAVGLENNIETGQRTDYKLTNALLDERIKEYQPRVTELENEVGLESVFNTDGFVDMEELKIRNKAIKQDLEEIQNGDFDKLETVDVRKKQAFRKLLGYYDLIKGHEERKAKFKRGNHECAVVVPNKKIATTFLKQFDKDWQHSIPVMPDGYGEGIVFEEVSEDGEQESLAEAYAEIAFTGKKHKKFVAAKEPAFNKLV